MTSLHDPDALERELDAALDEDAPASSQEVEGAEPTQPQAEQAPRPRRDRRRLAAQVVAALVVVGLVAGLVVTGLGLRRAHALERAHAQALQAGKESAVALSSYDYRHLDQDFGKVTSRSTPAFRASFTQTSASLSKVLTQYDATATSTVVAAGLTSGDTHRAVVLVFLNQVATNTNQKSGPTNDQSRVQVTLQHSGSRWLIDGVKLL